MKKLKDLVLFSCCLLIQHNLVAQIKISSNSFIHKHIPNVAITEAGMDFQREMEFSVDEVILSVAIFPQNVDNAIYNSWQIQVSKNDLEWNEALELYIRRTGDGKSDYNNKPQNGYYYQKIDANSTFLFSGQGWINSIPLQIKITGLSVTLPAKSYVTDIVFTLIDN
jgi:hypothetical protein